MRRSTTQIVRLALLVAVPMAACHRASSPPEASTSIERSHLSMGSEIRITVWSDDQAAALAAIDAAFAEFDRLDSLMSVWKPESDVNRVNAAAGDHPVPVSPEVQETLTIAHQVSEWTDGTFDVTFGAIADLWKFDQDQDDVIPDPAEVRRRLPLINYRDVVVDPPSGTAFLRRKGMRIHLGGIGKGYAVDRAIAILRGRHLANFMIQAGGDLYVAGRRDDRPWRLGIQDPRGPAGRSFAEIELSDATLSTSGDYERFFMKDGRRYHHILDLRVGEPARLARSVTLVTDRAVIADAFAKGVFVLGPTAGMALIERTPGLAGVMVTANNEVLVSSALKGRIAILAPPTDGP